MFILRKNYFYLRKIWINFKAKVVEFNNKVYCVIPDSIVKRENLKEGEEIIIKIN